MSGDANGLTSDLPIACNLSEPELERRRVALASDIFTEFQQVDELADGYEFRYPGSEAWAGRLLEFITFERKCCPFITFELLFEPGQGSIRLRLRGSAGVKEFIRDELKMLGSGHDFGEQIRM